VKKKLTQKMNQSQIFHTEEADDDLLGSVRVKGAREVVTNTSILDLYKQWKHEKEEETHNEETIETANVTKASIEQFFQNFWRHFNDRKDRKVWLENQIGKQNLSEPEKEKQRKQLAAKETEFLRLRRKRLNVRCFEKLKVIGKGAFGEVHLVRMKGEQEHHVYAMKKLPKARIVEKDQIAHVRAERQALADNESYYYNNQWITRLFYSFQDTKYLYLIMEFCPGGDMLTHLIEYENFTEDQTRFYMAELVLAIESIHKLNYIHRDIKPDNLLLDAKGHMKLSDFGLCTGFQTTRIDDLNKNLESASSELTESDRNSLNMSRVERIGSWRHRRKQLAFSTVGTPDYIAPEIFTKKGYTESCDLWSLGIVMYEMLIGHPPFNSDTPRETYRKILNFKETLRFPSDIQLSNEVQDLILKLCCDQTERLTIPQVKNHPFFRECAVE